MQHEFCCFKSTIEVGGYAVGFTRELVLKFPNQSPRSFGDASMTNLQGGLRFYVGTTRGTLVYDN